ASPTVFVTQAGATSSSGIRTPRRRPRRPKNLRVKVPEKPRGSVSRAIHCPPRLTLVHSFLPPSAYHLRSTRLVAPPRLPWSPILGVGQLRSDSSSPFQLLARPSYATAPRVGLAGEDPASHEQSLTYFSRLTSGRNRNRATF